MVGEQTACVLGSDDAEIARLDAQASSIAGATEACCSRSPSRDERPLAPSPRICTQAGQLLRRTGFADVWTLGIQAYFALSDPIGPLVCAGVTRSLAPQIVARGIADEAELGLETLQERITERVVARDAVILPPTVVGAWGTRPSTDP